MPCRLLPLVVVALAAAGFAACAHAPLACPVVAQMVAKPVPAAATPPPAPSCPQPVKYPFTNLVLEGGGVKGIAYGGALEVLDRQGILTNVERVAGTSAGAITAALVALGYAPAQVRSLLFNLDFRRFEDGGATGLLRLLRRYGYYEGDYYLELMRCLVAGKTGNPRSTFADMQRLGMRDLRVFTTDIGRRRARELSFAKSPDLEVALAVRMSGSFPLFFAAVREGDDVFVDGGVLRNYPIDAFDTDSGIDHGTLGFVLENTGKPRPDRPIHDFERYAEGLLESMVEVQTDALATDPPDLERTVVLDDLGTSTLDFALTTSQKLALIGKGEECTCAYLADWQRWQREGNSPGTRRLAPGERVPIAGSGHCGSAFPG